MWAKKMSILFFNNKVGMHLFSQSKRKPTRIPKNLLSLSTEVNGSLIIIPTAHDRRLLFLKKVHLCTLYSNKQLNKEQNKQINKELYLQVIEN